MNLIFCNGEKLYHKQQKSIKDCTDHLENTCGLNLTFEQKKYINALVNMSKNKHSIFGDDFKIDISPKKNFQGDYVLSVKDYDENQTFENEINICFDKDELRQFISLLQSVGN